MTMAATPSKWRSEEHTSELQSQFHLVCRLLLEKKKEQKLKLLCSGTLLRSATAFYFLFASSTSFSFCFLFFFFFNDTATTEIYTLSLHDALPIYSGKLAWKSAGSPWCARFLAGCRSEEHTSELQSQFHLVCRLLLEKKTKKTSWFMPGHANILPRTKSVIKSFI